MKIYLDCIPCFVRQTLSAARTLELDDETTSTLLRRILGELQRLDWSLPPPVIGRDIHRAIREMAKDADPYLHRKLRDTETALELLPDVEAAVTSSDDPFLTAVKFSIAGNAIDLGAKSGFDADVNKTFENALSKPVDELAVRRLEEAVARAGSVLFLADNVGEIVFDRPLLKQIGENKVTVVVRGSPVINDATLDDAKRSGITERFRVISNGSDAPGTWLSDCSQEFVRRFEIADLIVAKGQGNYESLSDHSRKIFFLFLAKCPLVSEELGIATNTYVIRETKMEQPATRRNKNTAVIEGIRDWFEGYVKQFLFGDEAIRHNIEIKLEHTRRVCVEIVDLAVSLDLDPEEVAFSEMLALLHDVGRFEQYERYRTYSDKASEDHAQLGLRILKKNRVLEPLDPRELALVRKCIGNHNRKRIPDGETEQCRFYSHLLRDADKLDIWRVITDYHSNPNLPKNPTLELDLPESNEISEEVASAVLTGRLADMKNLRTSNDYKVLQMSWIFDVNFPRTFQLVDKRKYLEKLAASLLESERAVGIYRAVRGFLDARL